MSEYKVRVPVGTPNDEKNISSILKEEIFRRLKDVKLKNNDLILIFSEEDWRYRSPKRVLQVSKKKYKDVYERIRYVLDNEAHTNTYGLKASKTWQVLTIIELSDKWAVFFV